MQMALATDTQTIEKPISPAAPHVRAMIVIPAHNEADSIGTVVEEIRNQVDYPIVLIDDASVDNTCQVAHALGLIVIPMANRLGAWGATQAGIRFAKAHGYSVVVTMDADGQHDPQYIQPLLDVVVSGQADVCIGACPDRGSNLRKLAWRLLRFTSGIRVEDLTSGFRAYNDSAINLLADWRANYLDFQDVGVLSLLIRGKLVLKDIETPMRERTNGHSRIFHSWLSVMYYMTHTIMLGLTKRPIRRYAEQPTVEGR